jgi:hypothetical protein
LLILWHGPSPVKAIPDGARRVKKAFSKTDGSIATKIPKKSALFFY